MGLSRNLLLIGAAVIFLIIGFFVLSGKKDAAPTPSPASVTTQEFTPSPMDATSEAKSNESTMVTISATGFAPTSITIKAGGSVSWTNSDSVVHTVNSDPHPAHTTYSPINLGPLKPGDQKSLTLPAAGTYKYHDHLHPQFTGTVIVQ